VECFERSAGCSLADGHGERTAVVVLDVHRPLVGQVDSLAEPVAHAVSLFVSQLEGGGDR
jgi:hypothetical protein